MLSSLICHFMLDRLHLLPSNVRQSAYSPSDFIQLTVYSMHVGCIDVPNQRNRTSVLLVPGRVVVYIKVHLVLTQTLYPDTGDQCSQLMRGYIGPQYLLYVYFSIQRNCNVNKLWSQISAQALSTKSTSLVKV